MVEVNFNSRLISIVSKGIFKQAPSDKIEYVLLMSVWVSSISGNPTILKVVNIKDPTTDLVSTIFPSGSISTDDTDITLPLMQALTLDIIYRVHVNFSDGTATYEAVFLVDCRY